MKRVQAYKPAYLPTEAEIAQAKAQIRDQWTAEEMWERAGKPRREITIPTASVDSRIPSATIATLLTHTE
jgi:hypothetical protein